ncbi:ABC transporter substrate-binding protein [Methanofollis ethanolicus]|uniref:ABC transporter substrate-binding protein n=1 Tax=Methanofollis ethanolicus TaxID=488124 RepID=UPI000829E08C|nr:ABC transporter substrate-binding protein [Methanofollis ethanolicus]
MTIYLGIDDTNADGTPGTGKIARAAAAALARDFPVLGVTRHQLYRHDDIPATIHNAALCVHLEGSGNAAGGQVFAYAKDFVSRSAAPGSNPGICVAYDDQIISEVTAFAEDAKTCVLSLNEARTVARRAGMLVEGFGTMRGLIGAVAAVGLAASGNDGRYVQKGTLRDLSGRCTVGTVLAAGVDEVRSTAGTVIADGTVTFQEFPKPTLEGGRAVLYVEPDGEGYRDVRSG